MSNGWPGTAARAATSTLLSMCDSFPVAVISYLPQPADGLVWAGRGISAPAGASVQHKNINEGYLLSPREAAAPGRDAAAAITARTIV